MSLPRIIYTCILLLFAQAATAEKIWIIADTSDAYHRAFSDALRDRPWRKNLDISIHAAEELRASGPVAPDLVVTLGESAAKSTVEWDGPLLHVFLTSSQFQGLYQKSVPRGHSAIYLDQPLERFVALTKVALPDVSHLILPVGRPGRPELEPLRKFANRAGLYLSEEAVTSPQELDGLLKRADPERDAMLFLPDPVLRSNTMMKVAIVGAYKRRIPLIAYSEGLAMAGALMSVHTTVPLLADEVADVVRHVDAGRPLPPPSHPLRFDVAINYQLADTLSLHIPARELLMKKMQNMRGISGAR